MKPSFILGCSDCLRI